jgi:hypothetical protein
MKKNKIAPSPDIYNPDELFMATGLPTEQPLAVDTMGNTSERSDDLIID